MPAQSPPPAPDAAMAATNGLRDIRGLVEIPSVWQWLLPVIMAAVLLALIALAICLWRRSRKKRAAAETTPPPLLPAHIRARMQLEAALGLLGDPDKFCTEVSRVLRVYLEDRFGWNAPDQTTEEFLSNLGVRGGLAADQREMLADFLTRCDMVKFARHDPTEPELRSLHAAALRMVNDTAPSPAPVAAPQPPSTAPAPAS